MNGIWVEFSARDLAYVKKVCRRKGMSLHDYIIDNFEWDDMPECITESKRPGRICHTCDYNSVCPDSKMQTGKKP